MKNTSPPSRLLPPEVAKRVDHQIRGRVAGATRGVSPVDLAAALIDWAGHLALSPGKLLSLAESAARNAAEVVAANASSMAGNTEAMAPLENRRMRSEAWQKWPFYAMGRGHELAREWMREATTGVDGVSRDHERFMHFLALQMVDLLSPANFPLTNPDVLIATREEKGGNLRRGMMNWLEDKRRERLGEPLSGTEAYQVGKDVAVTPGKVIFRNHVIELIQYSPQTESVVAEPLLIVPAWIMKYYILDLSPRNSLIRYLVAQGKTVFTISWKNPTAEDRDLTMHDYLHDGLMAAIDAVTAVVSDRRIHAVGYCLGGTLLSIAAAYMAREGDERIRSMSMFAAQVDFREAGEISLFLGEGTLAFLESLMHRQGYLSIENMTGAFSALRVSDLVHDPAVQRYLLGKDRSLNDLMAWNADGTRMPYRMHGEYLRNCYMENNLAEARYEVDGGPICVGDITVPSFVLGTVTDHVAPWKSVYKVHRLTHGELTFVLTTGGHNAGIACGPDHPRRKHQIATRKPGERYRDPDRWVAETPVTDGSWWPAWDAWLDAHSSGATAPPSTGDEAAGYAPVDDAPGRYVLG